MSDHATPAFDARATWLALDDAQRQAIGEAALLLQVATEAQAISCEIPNPTDERLLADRRWSHAEQVAWQVLEKITPVDADDFDRADLRALGIQACRHCGCTNDSACPGGCHWIEDDLCSSCAAT